MTHHATLVGSDVMNWAMLAWHGQAATPPDSEFGLGGKWLELLKA